MTEPTREELLDEIANLKAQLKDLNGTGGARVFGDKLVKVAHDLRTPLNAIIGFSELLREGAITEPQERDEALKDILEGGQRLLKMINDLVAEARAQAK